VDPRFGHLERTLDRLIASNRYRCLTPAFPLFDRSARRLSLCSNDYLGLRQDARVIRAAQVAVEKWGAGCGSARLIAGEHPCYGALEEELADFFGMASALLFTSGYQANLGVLTSVLGTGGVIHSDALNHASLIDGCRLARAQIAIYPHLELTVLAAQLKEAQLKEAQLKEAQLKEAQDASVSDPSSSTMGVNAIVSEGIFSMDGDIAPIGRLHNLARTHDALLIVDDAHGIGASGEGGRGNAWKDVPGGGADILIGTFGKAFGAAGAFVAGPRIVRDALINLARTFIFTTGPNPAGIGAAHEALRIIRDDPEPRSRLEANTRLIRRGLTDQGFDLGEGSTHIIPLIVGEDQAALTFSELLLREGIDVRAIRPPTVPEGSARLRLTVSAAHPRDMLEHAVERIGHIGRRLGLLT